MILKVFNMRKLVIIFCVCVVTLPACNTSDFSGVSAMISGVFDAESCTIDPSSGDSKTIRIEMVDPDVPEGYSTERIQSTAALILYRNLSEDLRMKYTEFKVDVSRAGVIESAGYTADQLRTADQAVYNATTLLDWDVQKGISEVALAVDNEFISDSMLIAVQDALIQLDSAGGKMQKKLITGFRMDKFRDTGEEVTVVWGEAQRSESVDNFTFYVKASNGKVVYMAVD